jgi:hypothetical protein
MGLVALKYETLLVQSKAPFFCIMASSKARSAEELVHALLSCMQCGFLETAQQLLLALASTEISIAQKVCCCMNLQLWSPTSSLKYASSV